MTDGGGSVSSLAQACLWALVGLPTVAGAVLLLAPRGRAERVAPAAGPAVAAATSALAVVVALTRPTVAVPFVAGSDLALGVDGLAAVVAPTVALVATLVLLAGAVDVRESRARFHGLMLVFLAAAVLTVTATTMPTLLLAWEVMGATSYALIGFAWREDRKVGSGLTAFVTTRAADLGLYVAAAAALAGGAGLDLDALASASPGWRDVLALGVLVAALGKAAQLVLAFWLSRAMDGPSPVSALLHSAAMVAMGGFLLLRLSPLLQATSWAGPAAAWAGALTTVALGVVAIGQRDLKQLLAASTSAQLGYVVMAGGLGAVTAGTAHLVAHAVTKAALFLAAGAWLSALGTKQLGGLRGAVAGWPVLRVAASVALLCLAGVPPARALGVQGPRARRGPRAVPDAVRGRADRSRRLRGLRRRGAAGALETGHDGRRSRRRRGVRGSEEEPRGIVPVATDGRPSRCSPRAHWRSGLLAVPAISTALASTVGGEVVHPGTPELLASGLLAIAVVVAVWGRPLPQPRWALTWLGLERTAHVVVVRPTLCTASVPRPHRPAAHPDGLDGGRWRGRLAGGAAASDDAVIGGAVEGGVDATGALARGAERVDLRWIHGAVLASPGRCGGREPWLADRRPVSSTSTTSKPSCSSRPASRSSSS